MSPFFSSTRTTPSVTYSFSFVSLVPPLQPALLKYVRYQTTSQPNQATLVKPYVRHSFLLFTWLKYLTNNSRTGSEARPSCAILPVRERMYALPRAPMAHKTNSHEHYRLKFFYFAFRFVTRMANMPNFGSHREALFFALKLRYNCPQLETGVFLLKSYRLRMVAAATPYFTYKLR